MSNVLISIASEFQKKGFQQAESQLGKLGKSVVKVTGTFVTLQQAQKAMLNDIADEKATKVLAQNLKNLGLEFAIQNSEKFIKTMEAQTGVLDDELRPAYAQLARVTGSTVETQNLMALAFDVSAGTGQNYASVIDALSQAYVGNNKGLKQLNIGLTQADLKAKSFSEITAILNKQFAGAGDASLDSYAGKMAQLQVATANASETIGKGLLDALTAAGGSNGFPKFISNINTAAQVISDLATGIGRTVALLDIVASPSKGIGDMIKKYRALRKQWDAEDLQAMKERNGIADNTSSYMEKQAKDSINAAKTAAIQKKLEADRLSLLKKQTAEKKAQAALDKANALVAKAKEQFDLEGIQLAAALQGDLSIEQRKRVEVLQAIWNLEQAIAQGDEARIASATALLQQLLGQFNVLTAQQKIIDEMYKIFQAMGVNRSLIDLLNLEDALNLANQLAALGLLTLPANFPKATSTIVTKEEADAALAAATTPEAIAWDEHERILAENRRSMLTALNAGGNSPSGATPEINITVNGAIDAEGTARTIVDVLSRSYGRGALPAELLIL